MPCMLVLLQTLLFFLYMGYGSSKKVLLEKSKARTCNLTVHIADAAHQVDGLYPVSSARSFLHGSCPRTCSLARKIADAATMDGR